jgi:hypothetical protein
LVVKRFSHQINTDEVFGTHSGSPQKVAGEIQSPTLGIDKSPCFLRFQFFDPTRSNFISAIAGFAVSNSKTRFLIIRRSRSIATAGLVKGEGFAVDASVMEADASRYHGKAPDEIDWSLPERQTRAVAEFLAALDDEDLTPIASCRR